MDKEIVVLGLEGPIPRRRSLCHHFNITLLKISGFPHHTLAISLEHSKVLTVELSFKFKPQLESFASCASFTLAFFECQTPVLTLSEAREMMEPQLERSVALFLLLSVRSVAGPQMVASPRLEVLRHRWMCCCSSWGEGCGSRDM